MIEKLQNITIKYTAILLLCFVVLPSIVKFAHAFEDHKHEVCTNISDSHFHEIDLECEFYKFKLNNNFTFIPSDLELLSIENNHKPYYRYYNFLNSHQQLSSYLRGPPNLM